MKVWSVSGYYDYEGHGTPLGIFSSREKAEEFVATQKAKRSSNIFGPDGYSVVDHEIDAPED